MKSKAAEAAVTMWIPNLRSSRAAALAVPLGRPYRQAIEDKLVELLEAAGEGLGRAAVQAYLEQDENAILSEDFPDGWADQILSTGAVGMLVMSGDPDSVEAATDPELIEEVMEELKELDLVNFLAAAPA
jgi:hypothetical protein